MRSVRTLASQGRSLPVLVLAVLLIDSLGEDIIFHPDWGFDSYEVTIPKKLSFRVEEQGVASPVSYLLQLKGKKHVLHLWPKRLLLPQHLPVFSFTKEGELLEDHPYIPKDCNYMGSVEGSQDSEATLSMCMGGLRGILNIDAKYYQIEPLKTSSSFEHVVYLLKKESFGNQICGLPDGETDLEMSQEKNMARLRDFPGSYMHKKYLELSMVFDQGANQNITQVINDAILLAGIMDTFFQEINTRIHLTGVEVWTNIEKIYGRFNNISEVLGKFVVYRKQALLKRLPSDWTHLYLKRKYNDALAFSIGRVCTDENIGSASSFLDGNILAPATWTTHELGHAVGMNHDEEYCQCRGRRSCLMGTGRTGFSNCSYISFFRKIHLRAKCLNNIPGRDFIPRKCGNKIVDKNEECDCGSREDCLKDRCCQSNCRLKRGANCSIGLCCHGCHFRPSGYMCRQEENECDLAEYCNGSSSNCPKDTYKQDGTPCKYEARCFKRECRSRLMQCQSIFGPDAREAPNQCYHAVNLIGDQFGNCQSDNNKTYKQCTRDTSICGRLQCINVKTIPDLPEHTLLISTHLQAENLMCWGTGYHLAMVPLGIPDMGMINDGTSCGENQVCFKTRCVDVSVLKFDCLPEKCNGRGVCNNRKNCHCMYGWAPPFCEDMGYGGSIDSGPPGLLKVEVPSSVQVVSIMLIRLIFLIISVIVVAFKRMIQKWLRPEEEISLSDSIDES